MKDKKVIRNFIYLDSDKLNSIYSQVFEGVAEAIVESYYNKSDSSHKQSDKLKSKSIEEQVGEVSAQTQNRLLHDHLYNQLEDQLKEHIFGCNEIDQTNFKECLANKLLVKIEGNAQIRDYERLNTFFNNFNRLGEVIAYSSIENASDSTSAVTIKTKAKELGLFQEQKLLDNLKFIHDMFYKNGFDVIISNDNGINFRAILNQKFLRLDSVLLRNLYTQFPTSNLIMLGQVTYIPKGASFDVEGDKPKDSSGKKSGSVPSMANAYGEMFKSLQEIEDKFFKASNIEIIISPIAIYTEQII